jgi:hypothetical protein
MRKTNNRGIRISDRDLQLLEAVHSARFLTTPQIQKLFWHDTEGAFGPVKACQRRLRLLTEYGLVRRIEQKVTRAEGSKPYLYALAEKGASLLAKELRIDLAELEVKPTPAEDNYPFLDHLIATTDIRIAVKQACDRNQLELVEWIDEKELRSAAWKDYVSIQSPDGKSHRIALVPDAYLKIRSRTGTKTMQFYSEIDRGSHTIRSKWNRGWTRKVLTYTEYFSSATYQKRFGSKRVYLLTVTTTDKRLAALKQATEESGGGEHFLFATQANAADPDKVLTAKIWHMAGRAERFNLLGKEGEQEAAQDCT